MYEAYNKGKEVSIMSTNRVEEHQTYFIFSQNLCFVDNVFCENRLKMNSSIEVTFNLVKCLTLKFIGAFH